MAAVAPRHAPVAPTCSDQENKPGDDGAAGKPSSNAGGGGGGGGGASDASLPQPQWFGEQLSRPNRLKHGTFNEALMVKNMWSEARKSAPMKAPTGRSGGGSGAAAGRSGGAASTSATAAGDGQLQCTRVLRTALMGAAGGGPFSIRQAMTNLLQACCDATAAAGASARPPASLPAAAAGPAAPQAPYADVAHLKLTAVPIMLSRNHATHRALFNLPLFLQEGSSRAPSVTYHGQRMTVAAWARQMCGGALGAGWWQTQVYVQQGFACKTKPTKLSAYIKSLSLKTIDRLKRMKLSSTGGVGAMQPAAAAPTGVSAASGMPRPVTTAAAVSPEEQLSGPHAASLACFLMSAPTCAVQHPRGTLAALLQRASPGSALAADVLPSAPKGKQRAAGGLSIAAALGEGGSNLSVLLGTRSPASGAAPAGRLATVDGGQPGDDNDAQDAVEEDDDDGEDTGDAQQGQIRWTRSELIFDIPSTVPAAEASSSPAAAAAAAAAAGGASTSGWQQHAPAAGGSKRLAPAASMVPAGGSAAQGLQQQQQQQQQQQHKRQRADTEAEDGTGMPRLSGSQQLSQKFRTLGEIYGRGVLGGSSTHYDKHYQR